MRMDVANLFHYFGVSMSANARYLEALAVVDDPAPHFGTWSMCVNANVNANAIATGSLRARSIHCPVMSVSC